jgi:hypothetical protein
MMKPCDICSSTYCNTDEVCEECPYSQVSWFCKVHWSLVCLVVYLAVLIIGVYFVLPVIAHRCAETAVAVRP